MACCAPDQLSPSGDWSAPLHDAWEGPFLPRLNPWVSWPICHETGGIALSIQWMRSLSTVRDSSASRFPPEASHCRSYACINVLVISLSIGYTLTVVINFGNDCCVTFSYGSLRRARRE
jgi:hypothetical protein